jgi:hypothetical protein
MYDLNILPIHLSQGRSLASSVSLQAFAPPRRAARGRSEDILILSISLSPEDEIPADIRQNWINQLGQTFFKTGGSVTSALRSLIETLNLTILERNIRTAQEGVAVTASVNLAAIHRQSLYLTQSGPTHAFVLSHQGLEHHADASGTDRGLGVSRTPTVRYYQDDLGSGAYFFTTETPPASWDDSLLFSDHFPSMDQLRRRLLNPAPQNFSVGLVQMLPGNGRINLIRPAGRRTPAEGPVKSEPRPTPLAEPAQEPEEPSGEPTPAETPQTEPERPETQEERHAPSAAQPLQEGGPAPARERPSAPRQPQPRPSTGERARQTSRTPMSHLQSVSEPATPPSASRQRVERETGAAAREALDQRKAELEEKGLRGIAAALKWLRNARERVNTFFKDLIARVSPAEQGEPQLSKSNLIFIAVAVPLVVVAITVGVYLARGRNQQYTHYYQQAQIYAQAAAATDDREAARSNWNQALVYIQQAESYKSTDETEILQDQISDALDLLDGAVRLDYRPALTGTLYSEIEITRIVSFGADLYMLDEPGSRVIHAERRSQGYEVDPDFICSSGSYEGGAIGALVDMVALPINNPYQAHVLVVDALGNIAYCAAGMEPVAMALPQPTGGEGEITAVAFNSGYLYALNPSVSSIRVYLATNGQFADAPTDFFEGSDLAEMPDLSLIADLAANGPELYLLQSDGLMIDCTSSGLASDPVQCESPVSYVDGRTGLEDQPVAMPDADYAAVTYTSPPDPSVSVLDATNGDIYRFSLRFRLYQRLRPSFGAYQPEDPTATAFTIGIDRVAFLAFGNELYFAYVD